MATRKRTALTSLMSSSRAPARKKPYRRYRGLIPTYSGYNPRSFVQGEWKYADISAVYHWSSTPQLILLNGLAPGNSASQRVGMKVAIRSVELRTCPHATSTSGQENTCRGLLVFDRQSNGTAPAAITDILQAANVCSPRSLTQRKRFKIVWDRMFGIGAASNSGTPQTRTIKAYIKFRRPVIVEYNAGTAGTIADISANAFYFCLFATEPSGTSDSLGQTYIRVRYTDM